MKHIVSLVGENRMEFDYLNVKRAIFYFTFFMSMKAKKFYLLENIETSFDILLSQLLFITQFFTQFLWLQILIKI